MPRWEDPRGPKQGPERARSRPDQRHDPGQGEDRTFGEGRGHVADRWAHDVDEARHDAAWPAAGRRDEDAGAAGYAHRADEDIEGPDEEAGATHGGEPYAYAGQEYGLEDGLRDGPDPGWGLDKDGERRRNFDFDDPGIGQSQAGYSEAAQTPPDPDFDAGYLRWREQQFAAHDREYLAWRTEQHHRYDEQYREFREDPKRPSGQSFHDWRQERGCDRVDDPKARPPT